MVAYTKSVYFFDKRAKEDPQDFEKRLNKVFAEFMADDNKQNAIAKLTHHKDFFKDNPELVKRIDFFI